MEIPFLHSPEQAAFRDRLETKVAHWLRPWDGEESILAAVIGVPFSKSSISHSGASMTPAAVRAAFKSFTTYSLDYQVELSQLPVRDLGDIAMHVTDILASHKRIEETMRGVYSKFPGLLPILIGGDHSISAPSVRAFKDRYPGKIGLIHFDAHHDVRNLEDGGPSNGTPFRQLLEEGVVDGANLVQIGTRGFMNARAYHNYVRERGVTVFSARDVRRIGMAEILKRALPIAGDGTSAVYVSFDVDVIDQAHAPGCPAIGTGGMDPWDAMDALYQLGSWPQVQAVDFVCIDPTQDVRNVTSRLAVQFMLTFLAGVASRSLDALQKK